MSTYAIGDLQGCYDSLLQLLDRVAFDAARDRLWLVGDLVNRGTQSLAVLRFVAGLGPRAVTVLGNHDIHLLMVAARMTPAKKTDTFDDVLRAPDREELLGWLRRQPLLHAEAGFVMVHAGVLPEWTLAEAQAEAAGAARLLGGAAYLDFFEDLYGNAPYHWHPSLTGHRRARFAVNAFTRMRLVGTEGDLEFSHKGPLSKAPKGYVPWFDSPRRQTLSDTVVFGHWSALGFIDRNGVIGLDTGCVWGSQLTALRLEDRQLFSIACAQQSTLDPD
ncbi:MAG: symmetrical bis(5'-nucleosyl)-tetraphosphatase [Proteobacteria bacterium]|nr:symmetrical bis(5'-nucleosyl)-tetraphosphatase [Burkholderiales bacterium]